MKDCDSILVGLRFLKIAEYTKTHKIALYFMFIHRENALKAIYHIVLYKKILIQNLIKICTKTHQIAHFFKIFSQGSPLACVQLISFFLYERTIFSCRIQSKYTLNRINYDMFPTKFSVRSITNLIANG